MQLRLTISPAATKKLSMHHFNYTSRKLATGPHLIGLLLVMAGVFALASPVLFPGGSSLARALVFGIGAIFIGLFIVFSYRGTLVDFGSKRMKEYVSVGGFTFGEWTPLPAIQTVKVTSNSYRSSNTPNGISPTLSGKFTEYRIFLYSDALQAELSFVYSKQDKAISHARHLADNLKADLVLEVLERE